MGTLKINTAQQFRRDNATVWVEKNPVLLEGEPGLELDTGKIKMGDGVSAWNALPYFSIGSENKADIDLSNVKDDVFRQKGVDSGLLNDKVSSKKYSTIVVGTTTAGHTKNDCDYLCTGTNDNTTIQNALNAVAEKGGGKILVLEGEYYLSTGISVKVNTILEGMGISTVLFLKGNFMTKVAIGGDSSSQIKNIKIAEHVNSSVNYSSTCVSGFEIVENVYIVCSKGYGVTYALKVINCSIENATDAISGCWFVFNNTITNPMTRGIFIRDSGAVKNKSIITQNRIIGSGNSEAICSESSNTIIIGNVCEGATSSTGSINLRGGPGFKRNVVIGNVIKGTPITNTHSESYIVGNTFYE